MTRQRVCAWTDPRVSRDPQRRRQMEAITMESEHRAEAIRHLEMILLAVDEGTLAADGRTAVAVVRRIEGALLALRAQEAQAPGSTER